MIGPVHIERCAKMLENENATNFQKRMVAEVTLYWCIYGSLHVAYVDLELVQNALRSWKQKWEFLLRKLFILLSRSSAYVSHS
jgi:hypothetical protein